MISRFLKKLFYLFRIMPVLSSLFFINIFFTTLIKLSSFKNTLNISKKNAKIIYKPNIKIKHLIIFQDLISKLLPFNTCLVKALSLHKLLMMMGIRVKVYIGIAENKNSLISHAWVEINGVSYYHDPIKNYKPILNY